MKNSMQQTPTIGVNSVFMDAILALEEAQWIQGKGWEVAQELAAGDWAVTLLTQPPHPLVEAQTISTWGREWKI